MSTNKKNIKKVITNTSLVALLATSSFTPVVSAQNTEKTSLPTAVVNAKSEDIIPNEYIVSFKEGVSTTNMKKTLSDFKVIEEHFNANIASVKLTKTEFNKLKSDLNIEFLEPNALIKSENINYGVIPQYALENINVQSAWSKNFKGQGIDIAVLDSGIAPHNDLRIAGGASMVNYTNSYTDDNGHGTHVAGIIAALDNNVGTIGVASEANLYSVKVLGADNKGSLTNIIAGFDWAINKGVDIINISIGTTYDSLALKKRINEAEEKGIIVVASAGNTGETSNYPALYDNVIAVGATNVNNNITTFSSRGSNINLVAPGEQIPSTHLNNRYANGSGTSQAAPHVSGILALYKQAYPNKTSKELVNLLYQNTLDLGSPGHDYYYGHGLVQFPNDLTTDEPIEDETTQNAINPRLNADNSKLYWDNFTERSHYRITIEQKQPNGAYSSYRIGTRTVRSEEFNLLLLEEGYQYKLNITPNINWKFEDSETKQVYVALINGSTIVSETEITDIPQEPIVTAPTTVIQLDEARNRIYWDTFANASVYRVKTEQLQVNGSFKNFTSERTIANPVFILSSLKKGHTYLITVTPRDVRRVFHKNQAIHTYIRVESNGQKTISYTGDFNDSNVEQPPFIQEPVIEQPIPNVPVEEELPPVIEQPIPNVPVEEELPPVIEQPIPNVPVEEELPPVIEQPIPNVPTEEEQTNQNDIFSLTASKQLKFKAIPNALRYRVEMKQKNNKGEYVKYSFNRNIQVTQFDLTSLPKNHEYELTIVPFIRTSFDTNKAYKVYVNTSTYEFRSF